MGIEDIFLAALNDLPFKDILVGETYPLKRKVGDQEKTYPVSLNTPTTCNNSIYRDLVPNDKRKSIIYLEKSEGTVDKIDRRHIHISEPWRLVVWMNMKLINKNFKQIYPFLNTVLLRLPEEYGNYGDWIDVYFDFKGQVQKEQVFSRYTYNETEKQFLIYPFGFFALDYEVRYRVAKECLEDVTLDADPC